VSVSSVSVSGVAVAHGRRVNDELDILYLEAGIISYMTMQSSLNHRDTVVRVDFT